MFKCDKCGLCCKQIGGVASLLALTDFPYKWNENGECEKLENNLCTVYDKRPEICNIDLYCENHGLDKKIFYKMNMKACNELKNIKICQSH